MECVPRGPRDPTSVTKLAEYYLQTPAPCPTDLIIAVSHSAFKPAEHRGGLTCVSPDEVRIAFISALAKAVQAHNDAVAGGGLTPPKAKAMEDNLKQWRHAALSCTFEFKLLGSDDQVYFEAVNLRERLITDYNALALSAYQRCYQIINFKTRKEASLGSMTGQKTAAEFNCHAKLASDSEPVTVDLAQSILTVFQHALKVPEIRDIIELCERQFHLKSPFNSITQLHIIVRTSKGPPP